MGGAYYMACLKQLEMEREQRIKKQKTMKTITFSEETLKQLIEDTRLELSYADTDLERQYYKGTLDVYKAMLIMLKTKV